MRKQIEKAIKTTLVVENKESIHYAVDKILRLLDVSKSDGIEREASCNHSEVAGLSLIQAKYAAMIEGKKIRHRSFMEYEYLYYKNGCWFTHDDYQLPDVCFLNEKEQGWWDDGWSVVS